jgi:hypothetical protein
LANHAISVDMLRRALVLFSLIQVGKGLGIDVIDPLIPIFVASNFHVDYTFIEILYAIGFGVSLRSCANPR